MGLQGCSLRRTLATLLLVAGVPMAGQQDSSPAFPAQDLSFFETSVRPILRDNCLACHNAKLRTSELSLESRHTTLAGGNRGPAVKPGDPAASLLIEAVTQHGDLKMPPPGRLRDEQIATLRRWIELGVPWPESAQAQRTDRSTWNHWAAQPPQRHPLPAVENALWVNNAIDSFVLARLEKEGLRPSAEADRRVLPRRVCLDLTGLPPSPKQIEEFLADTAPGAYERLVDRLLASPHYGERWGRHWLDVARYADSNGYNIDAPRDIWLYRDWVIQALNEDLPFDQFVIDRPIAALIRDLKQRGLLDETLVVWGGEFGRTPMAQNYEDEKKAGRNHHIDASTMWMAGGGIRPGQMVGETDELGFTQVDDRIGMHDIHATILHLLGLDHTKLTFKFQGRDFRLTDVGGKVIQELLA